jgi:hypothetical protein
MLENAAQFDISHFLVTRYNVSYPEGGRQDIHRNDDWLLRRRHLFETWCLPAVTRAATGVDIRWLILCAEDSPESLREWMASLQKEQPWIVPLFIAGHALQLGSYLLDLERTGTKIGRYVLSTRLDSDDAILPNFLNAVQTEARSAISVLSRKALPQLINFPIGYQISGRKLYIKVELGNPFLSVLEDRLQGVAVISCYAGAHSKMYERVAGVTQLGIIAPSWVQVLHDTNLANGLGGLRVPRSLNPEIIPEMDLEEKSTSRVKGIRRDFHGAINLLRGCLNERAAFRASLSPTRKPTSRSRQ